MISQAIPQALMAFFTIVVTFISMLVLSPLLNDSCSCYFGIMLKVTKSDWFQTVENILSVSRYLWQM